MSGSVIKTFADERLLASNLGISFFPSYRFGVAVKGNSFVLETHPRRSLQIELSELSTNVTQLSINSPSERQISRVVSRDF